MLSLKNLVYRYDREKTRIGSTQPLTLNSVTIVARFEELMGCDLGYGFARPKSLTEFAQ